MVDERTLAAALEQEHHEIDLALEAFAAGEESGRPQPEQLSRAAAALRRHIYLEEEFLFPPLRAVGLMGPVLVMLREHGEIWRTLEELEHEAGQGDPATDRCRELLEQLGRHNAKEEPIVYPEGDTRLDEETKGRLHAFIDSGTMPQGWVCAMAAARG